MAIQNLFNRSFGDGARQVFALHCTMAHSGAWRGLAAQLPETTVLAVDMLNHGRSPDWDGQGDFQQSMVDACMGLLDQPVDLVGHSFGATVALRLALACPEKVRSLTIIEPVYFAVAEVDRPDLVAEEQRHAAPFHEAVLAGEHEKAARIFNKGWGGDAGPGWDELPEQTRVAMARGVQIVPHCAASIIHDCHGIMQPGVLQSLTMPSLMLRGADSEEIIGVVNDGLARRLPDAANEVITGAGHMVPITHPGETATAMRALFDRAPMAA